jgi:hypothetical protein
VSRRTACALFAAAAAAVLFSGPRTATDAASVGHLGNPVETENLRAGTRGWELSVAPGRSVEGYASDVSVAPGGQLRLHVSTTPAASYRVRIFRLGWYSGIGAHLLTCRPGCATAESGQPQPIPPPQPLTGKIDAAWPVTDVVAIGSDWVTGYYIAELELTSGPYAGTASPVAFVVTALPTQRSAILVQASVNTWQAYNAWGGKSLYDRASVDGLAANRVSFDRPYAKLDESIFAQGPFDWEYQLVRFLEREGYDVSYSTDVDTDRDPEQLLRHRLIIVSGHDEYWSTAMRDAFEAARDAGTNLAFFGANIGEWHIRYEDNRRTIVAYKARLDPVGDRTQRTTTFRRLGRPECQLVGGQYNGGGSPGDPAPDYSVAAPASDPWLAETGLRPGDSLRGVVGYEWDAVVPGCAVPGTPQVLFHWGGANPADAVRYRAPSGARVFDAGTLQFSWALDGWGGHDSLVTPQAQILVRNALDDLLRPAPPTSAVPTLAPNGIEIAVTRPADKRVYAVRVYRARPDGSATLACTATATSCRDLPPGHRTYDYTAKSVDEWGESAPAGGGSLTVPDTPPAIRLRIPRTLRAGRDATIVAVTRDRDGDMLTLRWNLDGRALRVSTRRLLLPLRAPGKHIVVAHADDGHGGTATAKTELIVPRRVLPSHVP